MYLESVFSSTLSVKRRTFYAKNKFGVKKLFNQKTQFSGILKKSILVSLQGCDISIIKSFRVKCNSNGNKRIKKTVYQSVTILILGYFGDFFILRIMHGENANNIHYVYEAMVVLHIYNRILGIHHRDTLETKK